MRITSWCEADIVFATGFHKGALQKQWKKMIEEYLIHRQPLMAIVFLVDIRRKPTKLDLTLKEWLEELDRDYILVITKSDKLSGTDRSKQAKIIKSAFMGEKFLAAVIYSSESHLGRKELWGQLQKKASEAGWRHLSNK